MPADPRLASDLALAFVRGLQGGDGNSPYVKVAATCKASLQLAVSEQPTWQGFATSLTKLAHISATASPSGSALFSQFSLRCSTLLGTTLRTGKALLAGP